MRRVSRPDGVHRGDRRDSANRCMLGKVTEGYSQLLELGQRSDSHGKLLQGVKVQLTAEKERKRGVNRGRRETADSIVDFFWL